MTSQLAFIVGSAVGVLIGCVIGVFIYYTVKFRSWGQAWCRLVHRHTGQWIERTVGYGGGRHCDKCNRDWHRSY